MRPGKQLKAWRKAKKYTQTQAAKAAGVSQACWAEWESGRNIPKLAGALRLASVTGLPIEIWCKEPVVLAATGTDDDVGKAG